MVTRSLLAVLLLSSVVAAGGPLESVERPRMAVIDLRGERLTDGDLRLLTERLRLELFRTGQYELLERARMEEFLNEIGFQAGGCVDTECAVELGRVIGVRYIVTGTVGRIGELTSVTVRMVEVETGAIAGMAVRDCRCPIEDVMTRVMRDVATSLAGEDAREHDTVAADMRRADGDHRATTNDIVWLSPVDVEPSRNRVATRADSSNGDHYSETVDRSRFGKSRGAGYVLFGVGLWLLVMLLVGV